MIVKSHYSFNETYNNFVKAITDENPAAILAEIDHSAAAAAAGLELWVHR